MAIQNSPHLYTGGAVELDSSPTVNLYAQLAHRREAQRLAKEEAFDDYFRSLNKGINQAGVRVKDNEAFKHFYDKWQRYGLENKDKLLKKDINTQTEFNSMYQDILNLVNESKIEEEKKKPLVEIYTDPNKRSRLSSRVMPMIESHEQPLFLKDEKTGEYVRNRDRKSLDVTSNLFDPQFDFTKGFEGWSKGVDMSKTYGNVLRTDPKSGRVFTEVTESFTPQQVGQIASNAARSVADNPEVGAYYQQKFETLKDDEFKKLNEAFQSVYGKEVDLGVAGKHPNFIDSPEELAAAEAILQAKSLTKKGEEASLDRELATDRARMNIYISKGGDGGVPVVPGNVLDEIPDASLKSGGRISGGVVYDKDGNPMNGMIVLRRGDLPQSLVSVLATAGAALKDTYVSADVVNGQIVALKPNNKPVITRSFIENAQLKFNTEPKTGKQPKFGPQGTTAPASNKTKGELD
jgi:hypothetical protein